MDFTREPIIETIITPKEGYKLVIRSSTNAGQEEYFVDAVEVVAFGHALFFRSLERPKAFIVPVSDYEVVEVREARMVLKNAGLDRSIKIGGGREANPKNHREIEKGEAAVVEEENKEQEEMTEGVETSATAEASSDTRVDKKKDRRRHYRKRKGRDETEEGVKKEDAESSLSSLEDDKVNIPAPDYDVEGSQENIPLTPTLFSALLQPPPTLISETINRYRQNEMFKGAFYLTEEEQYKPHDKVQELLNEEDEEEAAPALQEPTFVTGEETTDTDALTENPETQEIDEPVENAIPINEQEDLFPEIKKDKPPSLASESEEDKDDESEAALPLYAEEDTTNSSTESLYSFEEEHFSTQAPHALEEEKITEDHPPGEHTT